MSDSIFDKPEESFPLIPTTNAFFYLLAGTWLEYVVEPRILRDGDGYIKGGKIEKSSLLTEAEITEVSEVLTNQANYGDRGMGSRCFFPGFAFTFGEGAARVEVLICLECSWVAFFTSHTEQWLVPNDLGSSQLLALYSRLGA
jgi:hypothetical protein